MPQKSVAYNTSGQREIQRLKLYPSQTLAEIASVCFAYNVESFLKCYKTSHVSLLEKYGNRCIILINKTKEDKNGVCLSKRGQATYNTLK